VNQFESLRARSWYEKDAEHVPANRISRWQNLCMLATSFPTHTQRKKLRFSETALSFAVKVRL